MYSLLKYFLFKRDPERIHYWAMRMLSRANRLPLLRSMLRKRFSIVDPRLERTLWGIKFPNPVGLAAGFDKDAKFLDQLSLLGFGFIEIGTVTPLPQPGNDKPRLFRLPLDKALINRMGFNNDGAKAAAERLKKRKGKMIIGGNIGKNKLTPNEEADSDYIKCFDELYPYVDYFAVNVSSPNTPNLRALQEKEPLQNLLHKLMHLNGEMEKPKPILLKIAPDLNNEQLDDIIEIVFDAKIDGVIATNTTIARSGLVSDPDLVAQIGAGGLSGQPLLDRSTEVVRYIHEKSKGKIPIIAVGGIFTAADAREKLEAGASLVQVYSGFIYEGPGMAKAICKGLLEQKF